MESVVVGMSGGVDSSIAALLLKEQGLQVHGATLVLPGTTQRDIDDAARVCGILGISHEALEARDSFKEKVIGPFADAYRAGLTPNPCVVCNKTLKFPTIASYADSIGAQYMATGHYAIVEHGANGFRTTLSMAAHIEKDQSYMLFALPQDILARLLLPLGGMRKQDVKDLAAKHGLGVEARPESEDICFIPDGDHVGYLERECGLEEEPGDIVDRRGTVLGRHDGLLRYTVGQRKGVQALVSQPSQEPFYVIEKDVGHNRLVVAHRGDACAKSCLVDGLCWTSVPDFDGAMRATAKMRYRQRPVPASIEVSGSQAMVVFDDAQMGIAPGQACVFYDGEMVLGGGTIRSTDF